MTKMLTFYILILLIFSACSHKSAGAHINSSGKGGGYIQGDILKF